MRNEHERSAGSVKCHREWKGNERQGWEKSIMYKNWWLTLTLGVRGRDDNRQQQRQKDQFQFAPHRCTAVTATTTAVDGDDASRIGAPGIARHVPETRTLLTAWTRWPRLTRTSWHHDAPHDTHALRTLAVSRLSFARAHTTLTLPTTQPDWLRIAPNALILPNAQTVATPLHVAYVARPPASPTMATWVTARRTENGRARAIASAPKRTRFKCEFHNMYYFSNFVL